MESSSNFNDCTIEMIPEVAQVLLTEGATFVFLDVPKGTDVGIDIKSWNTGEKFKGIKMIPPGFHFIHYSAADDFGELAPRIGFFHNFKKGEFLVKRWDPKIEDISPEPVTQEVIQRLKFNIKELDRYLGPYPFDIYKQWTTLTNKICDSVIQRCIPECGFVRSALELLSCDNASRPKGGETSKKRKRISGLNDEKEKALLPDLKPKPGTALRFTELPTQLYPENATPMEITKHSLDTSYALESLLDKLQDPLEVIGEIQLAFICFLAGQSFEAFEHWKDLISLICRADSAIPNRRAIYFDFLQVLEVQLSHVQEEILCDIVASNNVVYHNLRKLFANIESNTEVDDRLKSYASRTKERLTKKFLWDFRHLQEEEDDDAPVVVSVDQ